MLKNTIIAIAATLAASSALAQETTVTPLAQYVNDACIQQVANADIDYTQYLLRREGVIMDKNQTRLAVYISCMKLTFENVQREHVEKHRGQEL